ncbi:MAG TPA: aspartate/glutamate racemase family protein [Herpetosiphonaceae bacterium]|nr:aspartate/glutamate racemase family protein [Herpetosiphonaceae bacterium]
MRILVINPFGGTEIYGHDNLARVARPDTDFEIVNIGDVYPLKNNQWLYFRHECINGTIERALQGQRDGYDAVFLSCQLDVGLYECRQLLSIPVTATLESAALLAYQMGRSFSLLAVDYQNGQIQRMLLDIYGLSGKLASVRSFDIDANDLYPDRTPPHAVIDRVLDTARRCVEDDGAEALIPGCTLAGSVLTHGGAAAMQAAGAPIIDGMLAGFKLAEMWADLARAGLPPVSRRGFFEQPPAEEYERLRRSIGKDATPLSTDSRLVVRG